MDKLWCPVVFIWYAVHFLFMPLWGYVLQVGYIAEYCTLVGGWNGLSLGRGVSCFAQRYGSKPVVELNNKKICEKKRSSKMPQNDDSNISLPSSFP